MSQYFTKISKLCSFYEEYGADYMNSSEKGKHSIVFHENAGSEEIFRVFIDGKTDKQIYEEIRTFFINSRKNWVSNEKIDSLLNEYLNTDYSNIKSKRSMIKKIYLLLRKSFEEKGENK